MNWNRRAVWIAVLSSVALVVVTFMGAHILLEKKAKDAEADFLKHTLSDRALRERCPPGRLVEFLIGSTSVYVDVHSRVQLPDFIDVPEPIAGCPTIPLKIRRLAFFNRRVLPIEPTGLEVPDGLQVRLIDVHEQFRRPDEHRYDLCSGDPSAAMQQIEERTSRFRDRYPDDARHYCFHYNDAAPSSDATVSVSCGSPAGPMRNCDSFQILDALGIRYQVYQTAFPVPGFAEATSTDPATEPGALLLFDQRLRNWVQRLVQKP